MALPKKGTGSGTSVELSTDGGTQWKKFLSTSSVDLPTFTRNTAKVTDNESFKINNQMDEYVATFIEGGELTVTGFVRSDETDSDGKAAAEEAFFGGDIVKIRVVGPKWMGITMSYSALITEYQPVGTLDPDNGTTYSLKTKVMSKPEVTKTVGG